MSTPTMTSRERVQRAMERRDMDRVPRYETCWHETLERWMREGLPGRTNNEAMQSVWTALEADMHMLSWFWPHPFPGRETVLAEDEETRTTLGPSGTMERFWKTKSGTPEHVGWDCDSRQKWEQQYKPAFLEQGITINVDETRRQWQRGQAKNQWTFLAGVEAFEELRKLLGDEQSMYMMLDDPEWIQDIAETQATVLLRNYDAVLQAGIQPDGVWIYGDMAFKNMTFCSPDTYRELIWPQHKRIADWAHAHGMKMIFHSDGDLRGVMDLFVEAGFDCLQPLECKASMDVRDLAPKYGHEISFFGNIDIMVLISNDVERIEAEVSQKMAAGMEHKGYLYHSDHSIPPQVSWATYQAVIRFVNHYGWYH
jgi:uroporphyrinogen decarboxylase